MKKNIYQKCSRMTAVFLAAVMLLTGCGGSGDTPTASEKAESTTQESTDTTKETDSADAKKDTEKQQDAEQKEESGDTASYLTDASDAPEVAGLTCQGKLKLEYADCFDVYYYEDDYQLIDVHDSAQYLLVPEGAEAPEGLDDSIIVLQKPLDKIFPSDYMVAKMISEGMLAKLDYGNIPNFQNIDEEYRNADYDPTNEYSVPYMLCTTGIIYNTTMVDKAPTSWADLWDERYSGNMLMFNNSRDAYAIAAFATGNSINPQSTEEVDEVVNVTILVKPSFAPGKNTINGLGI